MTTPTRTRYVGYRFPAEIISHAVWLYFRFSLSLRMVDQLLAACRLIDKGLMDESPHVQFVMGVQNAMPADERLLDILLEEARRVLPHATWTAAGIGPNQARVMEWVLARSGDGVRTGLEDNIRVTKDRLAKSNAELVQIAAEAINRHDGRPATPQEARSMLGLAA